MMEASTQRSRFQTAKTEPGADNSDLAAVLQYSNGHRGGRDMHAGVQTWSRIKEENVVPFTPV